MAEIRISNSAEADLESIATFTIERFGLKQARDYRDRLIEAFDLIAEYPLLGSNQDHILPGTRRFVHESHSIYYQVRDTEILILRILAPGQDLLREFV